MGWSSGGRSFKDEFPLNHEGLEHLFGALETAVPPTDREIYTLDQFVAELAPVAGLRPVNVHKRRVRYEVGGCTSEVTELTADEHKSQNDRNRVRGRGRGRCRGPVGWPRGLPEHQLRQRPHGHPGRRPSALRGDRRWHQLGEVPHRRTTAGRQLQARRRPGRDHASRRRSRRNQADRAAEPLERTTKAIAAMADEARQAGVRAIAVVATAAFRLAENQQEVRRVRSREGRRQG